MKKNLRYRAIAIALTIVLVVSVAALVKYKHSNAVNDTEAESTTSVIPLDDTMEEEPPKEVKPDVRILGVQVKGIKSGDTIVCVGPYDYYASQTERIRKEGPDIEGLHYFYIWGNVDNGVDGVTNYDQLCESLLNEFIPAIKEAGIELEPEIELFGSTVVECSGGPLGTKQYNLEYYAAEDDQKSSVNSYFEWSEEQVAEFEELRMKSLALKVGERT